LETLNLEPQKAFNLAMNFLNALGSFGWVCS